MSPFGTIIAMCLIFVTMLTLVYLILLGDIFVYLKSGAFLFTIVAYIFLVVVYQIGARYGES